MASGVNVIAGFSLTNRWLLYTSLMLTPAQAIAGFGSHCISNLGFLAFNYYQQYIWFTAAKAQQLHALSLLPLYLNVVYAVTYLGGVPSGNVALVILQTLATAGLLILNNIAAWVSYKTNLVEGLGVYQFFFFGWRTLSKGWVRFFLVWNIGDTVFAIVAVCVVIACGMAFLDSSSICPCGDVEGGSDDLKEVQPLFSLGALLAGPPVVLFLTWPLIMWMELIVKRNNIVSETDMVSVYLFIAQAVALVVSILMGCVSRFGE